MASVQETWEAMLQNLNRSTVRFEPVRGKHKDIQLLEVKDGSLYFAYDTGAIFLDTKVNINGTEEVRRFQMGGTGTGSSSNSGFVYTNATINDNTLVKVHSDVDDYTSPAYYVYQKAFQYDWVEQNIAEPDAEPMMVYKPQLKDLEDWVIMPGVNTLLINSNGWIFRVVEPQTDRARVLVNLISSGATGGSGGGSSTTADDLFWEIDDEWGSDHTFVYGQTNLLTIKPWSTRDKQVNLHWIVTDTTNNVILEDDNKFIPNNGIWTFDTGKLPISNKGIKIEVYLDSTSSRMYNSQKPKIIAERLTVFRMDLTKVDPDAFLPLKGLAGGETQHKLDYIATGSSYANVTLHVYVDKEEYMTKTISSDYDGRNDSVSINKQSHGVHNIDLQLTTVIGGVTLYSNTISYQAAWADDDALAPIVWVGNYDQLIVNYETSYIQYMVYDPAVTVGNQIQVYLYKNGEEIGQVSAVYNNETRNWLSWDITSLYDAPSENDSEDTTVATNFSISVRGVKVDLQVEVTNKGSRDLKLVNSDNLLCNYSTIGRSNDEVIASRGVFTSLPCQYGGTAELSKFNWKNNGWNRDKVDANGVDSGSYLTVANGASISIPVPASVKALQLNSQIAYSIEIRFRIRNIQAYSTLVRTIPYYYYIDGDKKKSLIGAPEEWIHDQGYELYKDADGNLEMDEANSEKVTETENGIVMKWLNNDGFGFCLGTQEAYFRTPAGVANVRYSEDQVINISFVIDPNTELCYVYLNGILSGATGLPDPSVSGSSFTINRPFLINSNYCDFDLYRFRVYNIGLTMPQVIHNYLSDLHSITLYDQNNLARSNDATELDFASLVAYNATHPGQQTMPYAVWTLDKAADEDILPFYKGNNKSVSIDFVNPCLDEALENGEITEWYYYTHCPSYTASGVDINVQGTSSQKYPRRNYKTKFKNAKNKWIYVKGPLAGQPINGTYYFFIDDEAIVGKANKGKCVMKEVEKTVTNSETGETTTETILIPDTEPASMSNIVKLVKNWHMDQEAVATNKFTWKIDYMESSGSYNTGFANLMGNQLYPFYLKHPIEDLGAGFSGEGLRTSVYGFPVLVFQRFLTDSAKETYNNGAEYKYIGRYNKNLDKSSNEYYGFENSKTHPYMIQPWNEYKVTTITRTNPNDYILTEDTKINNKKTYYIKEGTSYIPVETPIIDDINIYYENAPLYKYVETEDTDIDSDKTYFTKSGQVYTAVNKPTRDKLNEYYEYVLDTYDEYQRTARHIKPTINQVAECWELRDNQGTWCSFRYPDREARSAGFGTLVDKTEGDNAQLEVVKHFEYRYTPYDDPMDDAMVYKSFQDENGINRTNRSEILSYLRKKYANLEEVFNWLDSTDPQSVPSIENSELDTPVGPWITSVNCSNEAGVGTNPSSEVFTYQLVGDSAFFDPNTEYYLRSGTEGNYEYTKQNNLTSLDIYTALAMELNADEEPISPILDGSITYYQLNNSEYIPVPIAQLTIPGTNDLITAEEGTATFKVYNFIQTQDEEIDNSKNYYTFSNDVYVIETAPTEEHLADYYEAIKSDIAIILYTKTRPRYYTKVINYYITTFTNDTRNYRLAKFRNEFEQHFDKEYCLIYFILTELLLCYDSRGKNIMLASWGPITQNYTESNYLLTEDQEIQNNKTYYVLNGSTFTEVIEPVDEDLNNYYEAISASNVTNAYVKVAGLYNKATTYNPNTTYYRPINAPYVWYPIFYDIDTQLGLNNSGAYLWDYDEDVTENNTFSTPNSVLWNNFYEVFYDDIVAKYRVLRGTQDDKSAINGSLNYKSIVGAYECDPLVFDSWAMKGIRPVLAIGLDEYYKYLAPTKTGFWDTSGNWQTLSEYSYAYTCQGDKKLTTELLLQNRLNYLDSQWLGGNYTAAQVLTEIFIRANANQSGTSDIYLDPEGYVNLTENGKKRFRSKNYFNQNGLFNDNGLDARAGYKIKPYLHQFVSYFVDNQPVSPVKYTGLPGQENGILTNVSPDVLSAYRTTPDVSQQINYIPAADYISSLGDLSLSYPNSIQIFKGKKLLDLNIGSDHPDYYNSLLNAQSDFSLAPLPLLKSANFSGLTNLGRRIDLSGSEKLQEFKALRSTLTMVQFASGAPLHTVLLPRTITTLRLIEHQELTNILTSAPVIANVNRETGEWVKTDPDTYKGLYIENVTDIGNLHDTGHALSTIEIQGGKLEYNSYTILKNLVTLKDNAKTNMDLSINYYDVHWSPYSLVEKGTGYDRNIIYYRLTDHSTFIPYTYLDINNWENDLLNEIVYTKNENAPKETIEDLSLLDKFIREYDAAIADPENPEINQFCGPRQAIATMPTITGSLYVNNVTPIYELTQDNDLHPLKTYYTRNGDNYTAVDSPVASNLINYYEDVALIDEASLTTYWKPKYPSLQITAARILESNVTKYVNVLDSGKEEIVEIKRGTSIHPIELTYIDDNGTKFYPNNPKKTNYDFMGWALDKSGDNMFIHYDVKTDTYIDFTSQLETYSFTDENRVLTLYAIFKIHPYIVTFLNDDGSEIEQVENNFSVLPGLKECSQVPRSSKETNLSLEQKYTWLGWTRKIGDSLSTGLADLNSFTPTADYTFVATYEPTPSSVYDSKNILNPKYLLLEYNEEEDGYSIALNPNYYIQGKITLPIEIEGKPVIALGTNTGSFSTSFAPNRITHIFWEQETELKKYRMTMIRANCFKTCSRLVYYQQVSSCVTIGTSAFDSCYDLGENNPDLFYQILTPVRNLGATIFSNIRAVTINIPGHSYNMTSSTQWFGAMYKTVTVNIGKAGDPCTWQDMLDGGIINSSFRLFTGLGQSSGQGNSVIINIYSANGSVSDELKACLGFSNISVKQA